MPSCPLTTTCEPRSRTASRRSVLGGTAPFSQSQTPCRSVTVSSRMVYSLVRCYRRCAGREDGACSGAKNSLNLYLLPAKVLVLISPTWIGCKPRVGQSVLRSSPWRKLPISSRYALRRTRLAEGGLLYPATSLAAVEAGSNSVGEGRLVRPAEKGACYGSTARTGVS
jgi:hypothetical protein